MINDSDIRFPNLTDENYTDIPVMVYDYVAQNKIIYESIRIAADMLQISVNVIENAMRIKSRKNHNKYVAGYEFFEVNTDYTYPKFWNVDPESAQIDRDYYFANRSEFDAKMGLGIPDRLPSENDFLIYQDADGETVVEVCVNGDSTWLSQKQMAKLFDKDSDTIGEHIYAIYETKELEENRTTGKFPVVQIEGKRSVKRNILHYNLDMILSVGYRVNSKKATAFRQWANTVLKAYLTKGYALDEKNLKDGTRDHEGLYERIRDIRTTEKRTWEKLKDLFKQSIDYNPKSCLAQYFFATIQNKLHVAAHGRTAAEVVYDRCDPNKPNMGMTNFEGEEPTKSQAAIGKKLFI